jgi:hypothetical protein
MSHLYAAFAGFVVACLVFKINGTRFGNKRSPLDKASKTVSQVDSFIQNWLRGNIPNATEVFREKKELLMLDWLEAHPHKTRMDFCDFFDTRIDRHCDSFARNPDLMPRAAVQQAESTEARQMRCA